VPCAVMMCVLPATTNLIHQAVDERYQELYAQCTSAARDLANMNLVGGVVGGGAEHSIGARGSIPPHTPIKTFARSI